MGDFFYGYLKSRNINRHNLDVCLSIKPILFPFLIEKVCYVICHKLLYYLYNKHHNFPGFQDYYAINI
jgi:hypothetical protein